MYEYPKIDTLWKRNAKGKIQLGDFSNAMFAMIDPWLVTEKIDGMNIRIVYTPGEDVVVLGRTDRAEIPVPLVDAIGKLLPRKKFEEVFDYLTDDEFHPECVILHGEGYGPGINGGGRYSDEYGFVLFDVYFPSDDRWSRREAVVSIAKALGIEYVHCYGMMYRDEAEDFVVSKPLSQLGLNHRKKTPIEGIVARPATMLREQMGSPLMFKLKVKDYPE